MRRCATVLMGREGESSMVVVSGRWGECGKVLPGEGSDVVTRS